jgi:hypothetical protein
MFEAYARQITRRTMNDEDGFELARLTTALLTTIVAACPCD